MSDPLNHRARKILAAVVQEYLATGDAVGSRTVTRRHGIDLSPATVRNVMSDLEEAGLLIQPHTSAGRVPTDLGLRFFVDSLLKVRSLGPKEREELQQRYQIATDDLEHALGDAARVLAELSTHMAVVITPRPEADHLEHLEFVRLRDKQLLVVIVTKSGQVQNKIIALAETLVSEDIERMNNYLNATLSGLTLEGVAARVREQLASEHVQYQEMEKRALELSRQALEGPATDTPHVIVEGQARLLENVGHVDPAELDKMKALFRAIEEKRLLAHLLEETARAPGIRVFIGAETHIEELKDFTLVATTYGGESDKATPLGTLGVIGPTRMNYSRVINLVDFTAQLVSGVIGKR
jgi:heat-inducible transcriptional repressor